MFSYLKAKITNIDYSCYQAVAELHFVDSNSEIISVVEKLDILSSCNNLPCPIEDYFLKCKIVEEKNTQYLVDISRPYGVLSENGEFLFLVDKNMISTVHFDDRLMHDRI